MNRPVRKCCVCEKPHRARGLCDKHYRRATGRRKTDRKMTEITPDVVAAIRQHVSSCTDTHIAALIGCTSDTVRSVRERNGIQSYKQIRKEQKTPCSHPGCDRLAGNKTVGGLCDMHYSRKRRGVDLDAPLRLAVTPELVDRLRAILPGKTNAQAGVILGCSEYVVFRIRKAHGIPPGRAWMPMSVPDWVPPKLVEEYVRRIRKHGEIDAASWARKEKRRVAAGVSAQ